MGYRSDVALVLNKEAAEKFERAMASKNVSPRTWPTSDADATRIDNDTGEWLYIWNSVKWYHSYEDVAFVEDFLSGLDPSQYLFLRTGDNYEDIEERGEHHDNAFGLRLVHTAVIETD